LRSRCKTRRKKEKGIKKMEKKREGTAGQKTETAIGGSAKTGGEKRTKTK